MIRDLSRVGAALGVAFIAIVGSAAEPIRIGELESLTGREAGMGQAAHKGFALALELINERGGVLGQPLVSVVGDVQSKPGEAATVAKKLVSRDKIVALLCGGTSSNTLEAAPICQGAHVPLLASASTHSDATKAGNYIFRACFIDAFQGAVIAQLARNRLKLTRVAVFVAKSSAYSDGLAREFKTRFDAGGGQTLGPWAYVDGEKDFRAQLTSMRALRPEAIFIPGYSTEAALICQQARALGFEGALLGGDGWEAPEFLSTAGKSAEGAFYVSHFAAERLAPEVQEFVQNFQNRYAGEIPNGGAALAYDATLMLADAIRRAGSTDGTAIRDALAATKNFRGATGSTTIDAQRNAAKPAAVVIVRNGRAEFFESISP